MKTTQDKLKNRISVQKQKSGSFSGHHCSGMSHQIFETVKIVMRNGQKLSQEKGSQTEWEQLRVDIVNTAQIKLITLNASFNNAIKFIQFEKKLKNIYSFKT